MEFNLEKAIAEYTKEAFKMAQRSENYPNTPHNVSKSENKSENKTDNTSEPYNNIEPNFDEIGEIGEIGEIFKIASEIPLDATEFEDLLFFESEADVPGEEEAASENPSVQDIIPIEEEAQTEEENIPHPEEIFAKEEDCTQTETDEDDLKPSFDDYIIRRNRSWERSTNPKTSNMKSPRT